MAESRRGGFEEASAGARTDHGGRSRAEAFETDAPPDRVAAVLARARETGLTGNKDGRISGRVSSALIAEAKARTGLQSDSELVEFALASLAIDDAFAQTFRALRGTVDSDLDLG